MTPLEARLAEMEASGADPALIRALRVCVEQRDNYREALEGNQVALDAIEADDDESLLTALEGDGT